MAHDSENHAYGVKTTSQSVNNIVSMGPKQTEEETAAALRLGMQTALAQVTAVMNEAQKMGLRITFNIGLDQYGRNSVSMLDIVKPL